MNKTDTAKIISEMNEAAGRYYHSLLLSDSGRKGMEYLKSYGLSRDTIDKFGIGFAADISGYGLIDHLKRLGYTNDEINDSGLVVKYNTRLARRPEIKYVDMFINEIIFSVVNENGHTVGIYGHDMEEPWLDVFSNTRPYSYLRKALFGINIAKRSNADHMIVCHGVMDTILMHQVGFDMTVSFLGIEESAFQAETIKDFTSKIILCVGPREYEKEWTEDVISILERDGVQIICADISPFNDATDLITKAGADEMIKRIRVATD